MRAIRGAALLLAALLALGACACAEPAIPYWREDSPALASIVSFVAAATDEASEDYVVPGARVAVFDSDGTLFGERFPTYFERCLLLYRLLHDEGYEADPEARAFAEALEAALSSGEARPKPPRSVPQLLAEAFEGFTVEAYRDYVRAFAARPAGGFEGMSYAEAYFRPMAALVRYLSERGFAVYICSGAETNLLRALTGEALGAWIPPYRIIGSTFALEATGQGDKSASGYTYAPEDELLLAGKLTFHNLKLNKVISIANQIGVAPALVFGNSTGDFAMGQYAVANGGRAYMLLCDDVERDYGDAEEAASFAERCAARGFETVSMRDEFETIYGAGVAKTGEAALEPAA